MINRELIRVKVVQIAYEHFINKNENVEAAERELIHSLRKSYELYHYLLMILVDLHRVAERQVEAQIQRWKRLGSEVGEEPSTRFVNNPFILQLEANLQLKQYCDNESMRWMDQESYLLRIYNSLRNSDLYKEYMKKSEVTYADHRQLWYDIYLTYVCNNEFIDSLLEDKNIYWNDDKHLIDSFVLKTIEHFRENSDEEHLLLPDFRSDADRQFAVLLLNCSIKGKTGYENIIRRHLSKGWDFDRISSMDNVIMQVALAEILNFEDIPLWVTINEFIEIAKYYSSPTSGSYVNGMLDSMSKTLIKEGLITKKFKTK